MFLFVLFAAVFAAECQNDMNPFSQKPRYSCCCDYDEGTYRMCRMTALRPLCPDPEPIPDTCRCVEDKDGASQCRLLHAEYPKDHAHLKEASALFGGLFGSFCEDAPRLSEEQAKTEDQRRLAEAVEKKAERKAAQEKEEKEVADYVPVWSAKYKAECVDQNPCRDLSTCFVDGLAAWTLVEQSVPELKRQEHCWGKECRRYVISPIDPTGIDHHSIKEAPGTGISGREFRTLEDAAAAYAATQEVGETQCLCMPSNPGDRDIEVRMPRGRGKEADAGQCVICPDVYDLEPNKDLALRGVKPINPLAYRRANVEGSWSAKDGRWIFPEPEGREGTGERQCRVGRERVPTQIPTPKSAFAELASGEDAVQADQGALQAREELKALQTTLAHQVTELARLQHAKQRLAQRLADLQD